MIKTFRNIVRPSPWAVLSFAIALTLFACSKDSSPIGPGLTLSDKDYLAVGWHQVEVQHYDSAATSFTSAYTFATSDAVRGEALEGRGWSSMYKRDLTKAKSDFIAAVAMTGTPANILNDARVGASFTLYALNLFSDASAYAGVALTEDPSYLFVHDSKVTARRLRLLLAQSYYAGGQFALAASQLDILVPSQAPHSTDPAILLGSITSALSSL